MWVNNESVSLSWAEQIRGMVRAANMLLTDLEVELAAATVMTWCNGDTDMIELHKFVSKAAFSPGGGNDVSV